MREHVNQYIIFVSRFFFQPARAVRIIQVVYDECNKNITYDSIELLY